MGDAGTASPRCAPCWSNQEQRPSAFSWELRHHFTEAPHRLPQTQQAKRSSSDAGTELPAPPASHTTSSRYQQWGIPAPGCRRPTPTTPEATDIRRLRRGLLAPSCHRPLTAKPDTATDTAGSSLHQRGMPAPGCWCPLLATPEAAAVIPEAAAAVVVGNRQQQRST